MTTQSPQPAGIPEWNLADRMVKAMKHADVSVETMAAHLGTTRQTVGNYRAGRTTPSIAVLRVWAMRCGVPYRWLVDGAEDGPGDPGGQEISPRGCTGERIVDLRTRRSERVPHGAAA